MHPAGKSWAKRPMRDSASIRGGIVNPNKVGVLAGNFFAALPIPVCGTVGISRQKLMRYSQLRDSS